MTIDTQSILESALHLPSQTRAFLADKLLKNLDVEDDAGLSPTWRNEIIRRCKEIDDGVVKLIPAERVFQDVSRVTG